MPELPDVEGFKRVLTRSALHKTIDRVIVSDARILGKLSAGTLAARLQGAKLLAARQHGKHLMASIDRGGWLTLHFGLTGALHFVRKLEQELPFTRVRLDFANDGCLAYTNKRMIGRVDLVEKQFVERMPKGALLAERKKAGHCPRCRSLLKVFKVGGRTAYCCPRC